MKDDDQQPARRPTPTLPMNRRTTVRRGRALATALAALAVAALALYAYRDLPARPFAADDYQWLLNVRGLSFGAVVRKAFDAGSQSHFYRPLVWLLLWAQTRAFDLDPRGYHAVSLALHLLNAFLLGWLFYRLTGDEGRGTGDEAPTTSSSVVRLPSALVAAGIVALHPAPFEAVVWISAQSELLAAALLLAALHLWLTRRTTNDERRTTDEARSQVTDRRSQVASRKSQVASPKSQVPSPRSHDTASPCHLVTLSSCHLVTGLLATLAFGLALLAKESAAIGLPLLLLAGRSNVQTFKRSNVQRFALYLLPILITLAYVALQVGVERRNYLLRQGGYGLGPQIVLNPLRSLALLVAPLPGTEHADAAWLVPVGALVALILLVFLVFDLRFLIGIRQSQSTIYNPSAPLRTSLQSAIILALALTLLPTAPFAAPPSSRYLYLPVMAAALLASLALLQSHAISNSTRHHQDAKTPRFEQFHSLGALVPWWLASVIVLGGVFLGGWYAVGEIHAREARFAAGTGPGGSLWRLATAVCAESRPDRMIVVEPPLVPAHAEAIVALACGPGVRAKVVGPDQVAGAIKGRSVVIEFPGGSARVVPRT